VPFLKPGCTKWKHCASKSIFLREKEGAGALSGILKIAGCT